MEKIDNYPKRLVAAVKMAEAVLDRALAMIDAAILGPAQAPNHSRFGFVRSLQHSSKSTEVDAPRACSGISPPPQSRWVARQKLQDAFSHWIGAIARLAGDAGMPPARAHHFAEDWVARLQGALTLQAATGNVGPFDRAMKALLALAD